MEPSVPQRVRKRGLVNTGAVGSLHGEAPERTLADRMRQRQSGRTEYVRILTPRQQGAAATLDVEHQPPVGEDD